VDTRRAEAPGGDVTQGDPDDDRRRRIRRSTAVLALAALAIYVAFVVSSMQAAGP
jgi:hypothetical protein